MNEMLAHFAKIVSSKENARVVALNKAVQELFSEEEICGTSYKEDKFGWQITTITPEKKYEFTSDYGWGVALSIINNPGYRIRECWYVTEKEAVLIHKKWKDGRLQKIN